MNDHISRIQRYREKLKDIYTIDIQYDQKQNKLYSHYNKIIIILRPDYQEYDFEHELAHLEFLTQEIRIKYLYPKEEFFHEKELFVFSNTLLNVIYDIFVDAFLAENFLIPHSYFRKKVEIFKVYLGQIEKHLNISTVLLKIVRSSVEEYIEVLDMILKGKINGTSYVTKNKITDQREHINRYLQRAGISNKFEWITYQTIYLREQRNNKDKGGTEI